MGDSYMYMQCYIMCDTKYIVSLYIYIYIIKLVVIIYEHIVENERNILRFLCTI